MSLNEQNTAQRVHRREFARLLALGSASFGLLGRAAFGAPARMLQFETSGNAFARGQQQGKACRELFHPWVKRFLQNKYPWMSVYLGGKLELFGASWPPAMRSLTDAVRQWKRHMQEFFPEGLEECRGVADGLGLDEISYLTVQCYDLALKPAKAGVAETAPRRRCTVVGRRDAQGRPLVGKTDDVSQWELGMNVLEITKPDRGYRHAHFHFAGTLWTVAGMNERGLAMGMNGIPAPEDNIKGMYSLDALHTILPSCANVDEAIKHIRALPLSAGGFSLLLGDANGKLSVVERTSAGMAVLPERKGEGLAHANEIVDSKFARKNPAANDAMKTNSSRRYESALRDLKAGKDLDKILNNRSPQGAICQRGENDMHTDFAVIFSPIEKTLKYWLGYTEAMDPKTLDLGTIFT